MSSEESPQISKGVLHPRLGGGPHGLGDPDDKTLRKLERDVLIAKKVREKSKTEKCVEEVEKFNQCCKDSGFGMVYKCRAEVNTMKDCLAKWFFDEELNRRCTEEYLEERSEYRRTGISKKKRADLA